MITAGNLTCIPTYAPTYGDGILLGVMIMAIGLLLLMVMMRHGQNHMIRESIFNPEAFKVRQDEYQRKLKDDNP